jgi:heat shock protein HtpX
MFKNGVKTVVLLAGIGAVFMAVGSFFGSGGLVIGFALGVLFVGGSYWFSDKLAVRAAGAVAVSEAEAPKLYAIVRDLTSRTGLPMPAIYLSPAAQPNAFATGRNPHHAAVAVTQGLLQVVDEDELRGVLAHELSHVANRDILITSVAAAAAMGITFVARMAMWGALFGGLGGNSQRSRGGQNMIGALAMMILAPIAAVLLQMSLSRAREFEADHSGAELLGTGEPLARALEKIDGYAKQVPMNVDPAHATAYIVNPLSGRKVNFAGLFQTHPPTAERIARLRGRS